VDAPSNTRIVCSSRKRSISLVEKRLLNHLTYSGKDGLSEKTKDAATFAKTANSAIPIEKATYLASPYYLCRHCAENPPLPPQALQQPPQVSAARA
jgi:hypothetical protein